MKMKKFVKMLVISTVLFLALTSCSASAQIKPDLPIKEQLCTLPPEPVFDRIDETDPENVKLRKLLNNIVKLKTYAEKLKATIECLNAAIPKDSKHLKFPKLPTVGGTNKEA